MADSLNALPKDNAAPETSTQPSQNVSSLERLNQAIDNRLEQTPGGPAIKHLSEIGVGAARLIPAIDEAVSAAEELAQTEYGADAEDTLPDTLEQEPEEPKEAKPMGLFAFFILLVPAIILDLVDIIDVIFELAGVATAGAVSIVWMIISLGLDLVGSIGMAVASWIISDQYLKSNRESIKKLAKTLLWAVRIGIVIFGIADDIPAIEVLPLECLTVIVLYVASHFLSREEINARAQAATKKIGKIAGQAAAKHNLEHPESPVPTAPNNQTGAKRLERRQAATSALNRFVDADA